MTNPAKSYDREPDNVVQLPSASSPKASPQSRKARIDEAIDVGIHAIRLTWRKLETGELHGSYGKQQLLQDIYRVYCGWENDLIEKIHHRLSKAVGVRSAAKVDVIHLLIQAALPEVAVGVVGTWTEAIRYGEHSHVRPFNLRGFLYIKGGLARCARLYRQRGAEDRREAVNEIAADV